MADAEIILRDLLDKIAKEQNFKEPETKVRKLSNVGANFSSFLFEATISGKDKVDLNLFAKVAAAGEALRATTPMKVYEVEGYFYKELLAVYKKLEENHNIEGKDRLTTPNFYGFHPTLFEETIVLEDLKSKGFETLDRFELLSWEYVSTAIKELVKLHALSFAYAEENPEEFAKALTYLNIQWSTNVDMMMQFFGALVNKVVDMVSEEHRPKFEKFVKQLENPDVLLKYFLPSKTAILKHGDFRASNLMHKFNKDGSMTVITIDYQTIQPGDPLADLFYLIFTGTDEEFRAKNWEKLLDFYYEELVLAMKRLGVDPEKTYSRKSFDASVKETLSYGLIVALTILPIVTVDEAPVVDKETDLASFMEMKPGDVYRDRLNGIINDYVKWGVL